MVEPSQLPCDGGLPRAGIAREDAVAGHVARGVQSLLAPLEIEAGAVGHGDDALLHLVESHHRVEFAHALLEGVGSGSKQAGVDVGGLQLWHLVETQFIQCPLHIAGPYVLGDDTPDVAKRPVGERAVVVSLEDGTRHLVLHLVGGFQMFLFQLTEESLHQFEVGVRLLHDPAVAGEEILE